MGYLSQLLTFSGIVLLACISPGPDVIAVTSNALNDRVSDMFVGLGIACAVVARVTLSTEKNHPIVASTQLDTAERLCLSFELRRGKRPLRRIPSRAI